MAAENFGFTLTLLGFLVLFSEQQQFPYRFEPRIVSPWAMLSSLSDNDLYSYILARKFGFARNPSMLNAQSNSYMENNAPIVIHSSQLEDDEQYLDTESRSKFGGKQQVVASVNPRFLFNFVTTIGSSNNFYNPLLKTIYYFTTATTTFTFTTTCISTNQFAAAASASVICRRRRDMLEFLSAFRDIEEPASEAGIAPSQVQENQVVPTARAMPGHVEEQQFHLASSKDEHGLSGETSYSAGGEEAVNRYKRLFISTTIVTTYVFSTVTTTRTLSTNLVANSLLTCRPSQFTLC